MLPVILTHYFTLSDFCCFVEIKGCGEASRTIRESVSNERACAWLCEGGKTWKFARNKIHSLIASQLHPPKVHEKKKRKARDRAWALGNLYGLERQNLTYPRRCRLCELACLPPKPGANKRLFVRVQQTQVFTISSV